MLAPRAAHRNYGAWMRDCLVKQGLEVGAAEALVQGIATKVNSSRAEVGLMRSYLAGLEARTDPTLHSADLALLDCMMARIHISLDRVLSTGALPSPTSSPGREDWEAGDTPELSLQAAHTLVPAVARLLTQLGTMARAHVLQAFTSSCDIEVDAASRSSLLHAISLAGTRCPATASLALPITAHLPPQLRAALEDWAAASLTSFPPASAWRSTDSPDSSLPLTLAAHTSLLASSPGAVPPSAIKHTLFSATRFACDLLLWCPDSSPLQQRLVTALFPLLLDSTTEHLADLVTLSLERLVGTGETEQFLAAVYQLVLQHAYPVLVSRAAAQPDLASVLVPQEILRFLDTLLDRPTGRAALASFFVASPGPGPRLTEVLLSLSGGQGHQAPEYAQRVLRFFSKLFSQAHPGEEGSVAPLTSHLSSLTEVAPPRLEVWLRYLVCGMFQASPDTEEDTLQENRALLQSLTTAIVASHSGVPEAVPLSVLSLLVPLATELLSPLSSPTVGFPDLMAEIGRASCRERV